MAIAKYRPVLSGPDIIHLIALCKRDGTKDSLACLKQLALYEYKINNEITAPAYNVTEKETLSESLGFETAEPKAIDVSVESLYNLWLAEPESLTVRQLNLVRKYRYENNKMTVDEEKTFETEILGV